jgi:hypothetical protein
MLMKNLLLISLEIDESFSLLTNGVRLSIRGAGTWQIEEI